MKNVNSMATVRIIAKKAKDIQDKAAAEVGSLTKVVNNTMLVDRLRAFLSTAVQTAQPYVLEDSVALIVSCVSVIISRQLGIENVTQTDSIRGGMEIEQGTTETRDESLPCVVVKAKLVKVIAAAGKYFMGEWSRSLEECIDAVS